MTTKNATRRESPSLNWLIDRLAELNSTITDPKLVTWHAHNILWSVNKIRLHRLEANRRDTDRALGPAVELRRLRQAVRLAIRNGDNAPWMKSWAETSARTRNFIWRPRVPPVKTEKRDLSGRLLGFERYPIRDVLSFVGPGMTMLAPRPDDALPLIREAVSRLKATPSAQRRRRSGDRLVVELSRSIKDAYEELTGKPLPPSGSRIHAGQNALTRLAHEISIRFKLYVYPEDSPRLRALRKN